MADKPGVAGQKERVVLVRKSAVDRKKHKPPAAVAAPRPAKQAAPSVGVPPPELPLRWAWILVGLILIAFALIRGRLLEFPLERDEGEYAYAGQLMLQGIPPYQYAYNMKLPGTYAAYAVLMAIFGQTTEGVHLGLIVVTSITLLLVFLLGQRLFGARAGVAAASAYGLMALGQGVYGNAAHATHFVSLFAVAGMLALLHAGDSGRRGWYFASGLLLGLAFLMKQHGVLFIFLGGALAGMEWRRSPRNWRTSITHMLLLGVSTLIPFVVTCAILAWAGVFDRFWFWTFTYAREYVGQMPWQYAWEVFRRNGAEVVVPNLLLWFMAAAGLIAAWLHPSQRRAAAWLTALLVFSFLAVCPGLHFRPHYFIVMLPAVALAAGAAVPWLGTTLSRPGLAPNIARVMPSLIFLAALGSSFWYQREFLFELTSEEACRSTYPFDPFPESLPIARYLQKHTTPEDRIAVVGSEPQLYFYSGRRSATGYIYTYALMEEHPFALTMQQEMIAEIEQARPKFLIMVRIHSSWVQRSGSNPLIMDWIRTTTRQNYDQVGVVEVDEINSTYRWDDQAANYSPNSPFVVFIFRRKEAPPP